LIHNLDTCAIQQMGSASGIPVPADRSVIVA